MITSQPTPPPVPLRSALVIDDHPLFCDALSMTLQAVSDVRDITTAACLRDALALLENGPAPDIVVLDLNLPDVSGLDGLVRLRNATTARIVVVSSMADNRVVSSAIHAGANGFVPKHSQREIFRRAFETLERGKTYLPDGCVLLENPEAASRDDAVARLASLTNQQARILHLICEGKLNKQIAFDLSIAETTVKAHVTAIMRKLGVHSRTQAVLIAQQASFEQVLRGGG